MTEIVQYQEPTSHAPALAEVMDYARAVASASMLPDNYRGKPADIMLAVGLGQSMGLSPAESLYRISVIKGKPSASAELIAANVRKAGHKLRVVTDEAAQSVTATILRADDPEFPFTVTRDMKWAQAMGLATNDNYRKQALTMLQWRAITAVARLACPEALYGVAYTPDELADDGPRSVVTAEQVPSAADRMRQVLHPEPSGAEEAADVAVGNAEPSAPESLLDMRSKLAKRLFAVLNEAGIPDAEQRECIVAIIGREIQSRKELSEADAIAVINALEASMEQPFPSGGE